MSGFISKEVGIAASVFIPLWFIIAFLSFWRGSTWWIVLCCAFRVIAEAFQLVYAVKGETAYKWQVSYLIMTTQSQYMIIVTMVTLFVLACDTRMKKAFKSSSSLNHYTLTIIYAVIADVVGIVGIALFYTVDFIEQFSELDTLGMVGLILQMIGQAWFLALVTVVTIIIAVGWFRDKHNARILLVLAGCFMIVRCVYGVLQPSVHRINFFQDANYTYGSLDSSVVVYDKVLGATMEWLALLALICVQTETEARRFAWRTMPDKI